MSKRMCPEADRQKVSSVLFFRCNTTNLPLHDAGGSRIGCHVVFSESVGYV